jgi:hypothetical protein
VIDEDGNRETTALDEGLPEVEMSEWNEYRLIARGRVVEHWLNGTLAARIEDREAGKRADTGVIAIQLHAGPPMRGEFKDIRLKRLSSEVTTPTGSTEEASVSDAKSPRLGTSRRFHRACGPPDSCRRISPESHFDRAAILSFIYQILPE